MRDWEGPDGAAVADALMASDAQTAGRTGPDFEALKAERQALRFGVGELRRRIQTCSDEIRVIKRETCAKVAGHLADPLVAVLEADAIAAARSFVAAYASIIALTEATKSGRAAKIKWEIEEAIKYLFKIEGFRTANGPVIEIPKDIRAMLQAMEVKGVALPNRLPETLPIPW